MKKKEIVKAGPTTPSWEFIHVKHIMVGEQKCDLSILKVKGNRSVPVELPFNQRLKNRHPIPKGKFRPAMRAEILANPKIVRRVEYVIPLRVTDERLHVIQSHATQHPHEVPFRQLQLYPGLSPILVLSGPSRREKAASSKKPRQSTPKVGVAKMRVSTQKPRSQHGNPKEAQRQA